MELRRDEQGVAHIIGLSGGKDSTCLALLLKEHEPRPYNYVCTPTGNELPDMLEALKMVSNFNWKNNRTHLLEIVNAAIVKANEI